MFYTSWYPSLISDRDGCEGTTLIITTTDPITGEHLHNLAAKPFVIEGKGRLAVKVYFESEENRSSYIHRYHSGAAIKHHQ